MSSVAPHSLSRCITQMDESSNDQVLRKVVLAVTQEMNQQLQHQIQQHVKSLQEQIDEMRERHGDKIAELSQMLESWQNSYQTDLESDCGSQNDEWNINIGVEESTDTVIAAGNRDSIPTSLLTEHNRIAQESVGETVPKRTIDEFATEDMDPNTASSSDPLSRQESVDETVPKRTNEECATEDMDPNTASSSDPLRRQSSKDDRNEQTQPKRTDDSCQRPSFPTRACAGLQTNGVQQNHHFETNKYPYQTNGEREFKDFIAKSGNSPLKKRTRNVLIANFCFLKDNLRPVITEVADYMFSNFVLREHQLDVIDSINIGVEKCRYLVKDVLLHSCESAFWVFMEALEKYGGRFIEDQLLGGLGEHVPTGQMTIEVDFPNGITASGDDLCALQTAQQNVERAVFVGDRAHPATLEAIQINTGEVNQIVNDVEKGSILLNMSFYTVDQLDSFWMWVNSKHPSPLSESLSSVLLTDEIRSIVPQEIILSLKTSMTLDEYLAKRCMLLKGNMPMKSRDDLTSIMKPSKQWQQITWLDVDGVPREDAGLKDLLTWAYENGHRDPLSVLTRKFPRYFDGYDEKDFRLERLHKLIAIKSSQNLRLKEKLAPTERCLKGLSEENIHLKVNLEEAKRGSQELSEKLAKAERDLNGLSEELAQAKDDVMRLSEENTRLKQEQRTLLEKYIYQPVTNPNDDPYNMNMLRHVVPLGKSRVNNQSLEDDVRFVNMPRSNKPDAEREDNSNMDNSGAAAKSQDVQQQDYLETTKEGQQALFDDSSFRGEQVYGKRVRGISTVICVDTSGSMEGQPFLDMKNAIHKMLDDIEYTNNVYEFKESVGIVECGSGSSGRTLVGLTDNYDRIRRVLDGLKPGAMSPLAVGIREAVHELKRNSGVLVVSGQMVPSRMLVFTDGIPTDEKEYGHGTDLTTASTSGKYKVLTAVQTPFNESVPLQATISFIGCGESRDRIFLENAAKTGKGKCYRAENELDIRRLGGYYRRLVWVCRFICPFREKGDINQLVNTKATFESWLKATKSTEIFEADLSDFDMDEMYQILQKLIGPRAKADLNIEDLQMTAMIQREMPLGVRVRRGPDWEYGDQDLGGPGTVTGYEKGGRVDVQWDHSDENFIYRYGFEGRHDIRLVEEPRILKEDEFIKPGVKVRRGPHWCADNNDGGPGSVGTVYKVESSGIVYVLWPTRVASNHRYGYDGKFEVEIVEESFGPSAAESEDNFNLTEDGKCALWQWNSNGAWTVYPRYVNSKLERSYRRNPTIRVDVNVGGLCHTIDFKTMTALCKDINESYDVQRTELSLDDFEAVRVGLDGY